MLDLREKLLIVAYGHRTGIVFALHEHDNRVFRCARQVELDRNVEYYVAAPVLRKVAFFPETLPFLLPEKKRPPAIRALSSSKILSSSMPHVNVVFM